MAHHHIIGYSVPSKVRVDENKIMY